MNREALALEINFKINEEKILAEINNRTVLYSTLLWTRRLLSIAVNIVIIIYSSLLIIEVYNNDQLIQNELVTFSSALKSVANFAPQICISVINLLIPTITKALAAFEKWDFVDTTIQNEIWRSYIGKLFNLFIFLLLNFQGLFG